MTLRSRALERLSTQDKNTDENKVPHQGTILYAHGGGFVAVSSAHLKHSVSPLVRLGYEIYSIDYPLAPEDPFPAAVISTLRALAWMKKERGVRECVVMGDSAGGGLITYAAAALNSAIVLRELEEASGEMLTSWEYPCITKVVSIYGFVCQKAWRDSLMGIPLSFCIKCYAPEVPIMGEKYTIQDIASSNLSRYPPSLLICAEEDSLTISNENLARRLRALGRNTTVETLPGFHSFLGFPIQWTFGQWRSNTLPATDLIIEWLSEGRLKMKRFEESMPFDWSAIIVLSVTLLLPLLLAAACTWAFIFSGSPILGISNIAEPTSMELLPAGLISFAVISVMVHYLICVATDRFLSLGIETEGFEVYR